MTLSGAECLLLMLGGVLVLESLLPLLAIRAWRETLAQLLGLNDGQVRFFALGALLVGAGFLFWALA